MIEHEIAKAEALRCKCREAEFEAVPGLPNCLKCIACGGWFAARIHSTQDWERFNECFAQPDGPPSK